MYGPPSLARPTDRPISREVLLTLVNTATQTGELRYARRLCTSWLASFPGDMGVRLLNAKAYLKESTPALQEQAVPILEVLCDLDPEFSEAQTALAEALQRSGSGKQPLAKACATALTHGHPAKNGNGQSVASWAKNVYEARSALEKVRTGDYQQIEKAEYFIHKALVENPDTPLASVVHLRLVDSQASMPKLAIRNLAQIYHERWPDCLQFTLNYADQLMESGETAMAVDLLHQAVSKDITGQVVKRMWGEAHPYAAMWPASLEIEDDGMNSPHNLAIPAAVAATLGWNQLGSTTPDIGISGDTSSTPVPACHNAYSADVTQAEHAYAAHGEPQEETPALSESTKQAQTELERMANELKRPHIAHEDGRFPVYVIFTTRQGLQTLYSPASIQRIESELKRLAGVIRGKKVNQEFWGSLLFYADDPASTQPYSLQPAPYNDAWKLKTLLAQLDTAMNKRGERIGALLIVGGPEVVPFHNLPNPVEDADNEVPSDNPYAARDNNYFISDWPVGRISGGVGNEPTNLLKMVKEVSSHYDQQAEKPAWYRRLMLRLRELFKAGLSKKLSSFGYTAAVWKRASLAVFRPIGTPDDLVISPPVHACGGEALEPVAIPQQTSAIKGSTCLVLPNTQLAYFNLHGVPDSSEWYGQTDPTTPEAGPEFPVAMRPEDIRNGGSAPRLVFTEACYGANINGKGVEEAISLKFLASGTQVVVGSTCISYGSLATPLSSADLLGRVFWDLLQEGFTAGESLRRAKIHLTREMNQRQGFLDAEDQKTLISFVLFGDPLAQPFKTKVTPKVTPHLSDAAVPVATMCERSCEGEAGSSVPLETISHLKSIVAQYLPGMNDAEVRVAHEHQRCASLGKKCSCGQSCQFSKIAAKKQAANQVQRRVVTLNKTFEHAQRRHTQYARLTLDERGKIVKMVVSH
ncbi:MAG: hypothetical protein C3F13_06665 [Anaerolineales bacterium]|nr:hypothetical protein [Anaerolineae bacterium]PWB54432.1 MAG: hypothetical protein C3F13_06665 [Anaerolineales bacterium]